MHARTSDEIPEAQDESQPSPSVQSCNRRHKQDSMHRDSFSYTACFTSYVYVVDIQLIPLVLLVSVLNVAPTRSGVN